MPAVVQIHRLTGSTPDATVITEDSTRFSTSDNPNPGAANKLEKLSSGVRRSFWVTTRLFVEETPDSSLNNVKWRTDGTNPWGGILMNVASADSYVQATGTMGVTGTELTQANHSGLNFAPVNGFSLNPGSPLILPGQVTNPNTGYVGDFVVAQFVVTPTALLGVVDGLSGYFLWDEA